MLLNPETDAKLRDQILKYHISDVLTDSERAKLLGLPEGCRIRERAKILAPDKLTLGKNIWIGEGAMLDAQGGLTIGDYTQIGLNVMIWTHSSHKQAKAGKTGDKNDEGIIFEPTKIGSHCFIAGPCVICPGVTIGNRVIVSPLTFVDRDVKDDEVVSGPRELKKLKQHVERLTALVEALAKRAGIDGHPKLAA